MEIVSDDNSMVSCTCLQHFMQFKSSHTMQFESHWNIQHLMTVDYRGVRQRYMHFLPIKIS